MTTYHIKISTPRTAFNWEEYEVHEIEMDVVFTTLQGKEHGLTPEQVDLVLSGNSVVVGDCTYQLV